MGYRTRYQLEWDDKELAADDVIHALVPLAFSKRVKVQDDGSYRLIKDHSTLSTDLYRADVDVLQEYHRHVKQMVSNEDYHTWYEHDNDVLALSIKFPTVLFTLTGEGENPGDLWRTYYRKGRMHKVKGEIVYPPLGTQV